MPSAQELKQRIEAAIPGASRRGRGPHRRRRPLPAPSSCPSLRRALAARRSTGWSTTSSARRSAAPSTPCPSPLRPVGSHDRRAPEPHSRRDPEAIDDHDVILFMKGTPGGPGVRLLGAHRRRARRRSARRSRPSTSCPTRASARSCRRSRTGRRSPSCSSSGELVGGCDIVTEMYETGELAQTLGVEPPDAAPAEAPAGRGAGPGADGHREPPGLTPRRQRGRPVRLALAA